jgi:lipopolysaccharide export system protein LptC
MKLYQYRVHLVLFALAVSSWWLADLFEGKEVHEVAIVDHSADYFSLGYYKKEMSREGLIKNELKADQMIHYGDDETTHLESPVMTLYNSKAPPWVIKSEAGILEANGDHLQLNGEVFISRAGDEKINPLDINTSNLRIKLSISYAETDEWAEIINTPNRTEGVGLEATFVEPIKLKFLSKVKGRYEFN